MPPSPSKIGGDKNFRKQSDVGMADHKTLISRRGVAKFSWEGLKKFARKMKIV